MTADSPTWTATVKISKEATMIKTTTNTIALARNKIEKHIIMSDLLK